MPPTPLTRTAAMLVLAMTLVTSAGAVPTPDPSGVDHAPTPRVWTDRGIPTDRDLHSVSFSNTSSGWVGAQDGIVYVTDDGGRTWRPAATGLAEAIVALSHPTADVGYAAGEGQGVARTTDGGETWTVVQEGGYLGPLNDLVFTNATHGYRTGVNAIYRGFLQETHDGGETWRGANLSYPTQESRFRSLDVGPGDTHTWVLTRLFEQGWGVSRTTDGGANWTFHTIPDHGVLVDLHDLDMANRTTGVAVGARGEVHRTTDGGENWTRIPVPTTSGLLDVEFLDDERGWAVGAGGTVLRTVDGGATWFPEASGAAETLRAVDVADGGAAWATGPRGLVRHRPAEPAGAAPDTPEGDPVAERPPVVIAGDGSFQAPNSGVVGGSGTAEDPYVIAGWAIRPAGPGGIVVVGTDAHVVVRDNLLRDGIGGAPAVRLVDAANVTVAGNRIRDAARGVEARASPDLTVRGNSLRDLEGAGIALAATPRARVAANDLLRTGGPGIQVRPGGPAEVVGNAVEGTPVGIAVGAPADRAPPVPADVRVAGNDLEANPVGVRVRGVVGPTVEANVVSGPATEGIRVRGAADVAVRANAVFGGVRDGIVVGPAADDVTVAGNDATAGHRVLSIRDASGTDVAGNHLAGGRDATVRLARSTDAGIQRNHVEAEQLGIEVVLGSRNATIRENEVATEGHGIWLRGSEVGGNLVVDNTVTAAGGGYPGAGLYAAGSHADAATIHKLQQETPPPDVFRDNVVVGTLNGISVAGGENHTLVEGNRFVDAVGDAVSLANGVHNVTVRGNTVDGGDGAGIELVRRADDVTVIDNVVRDVEEEGLLVGSSSRALLEGNVVRNASVGYRTTHECPYGESNCNSTDNRLAGNTFEAIRGPGLETEAVLWGRSVNLTVEGNTWTTAGPVWRLREAESFAAHGNALEADAVGLDATRSGPVDVTRNWWGTSDGPSGEGPGSGASVRTDKATTADWSPWLESAPDGAGAGS